MRAPDLVLYHAQCRDGFCAAWVAHQSWKDAEYRPVMYGTAPPAISEIEGKHVMLLDFCFPRPILVEMLKVVAHLTILDHHKTAQADLVGLEAPNATIVFDMDRSGAGITWDETFSVARKSGTPRPLLVDYVQDRDLWRWALPDSRAVNAWISSLRYGQPVNFHEWNDAEHFSLTEAINAGQVALQCIRRYTEAVCENAVRRNIRLPRDTDGWGWDVPSVNAPQHDISEVLERLLDLNPKTAFVHGWWQRADGMYAQSFRSRGEFDVSVIAKAFGGGGHKNAAGAQTHAQIGGIAWGVAPATVAK